MTRKLAFSASAVMGFASLCVYAVVMAAPFTQPAESVAPVQQGYELNDSHFHLTNYVQGAFFPVKHKLEVYGVTSQIFGDKDAGFSKSSEYIVGANFYPTPTRNHRLNMQIISVDRSPVSSAFGYYVGGQKGTTYSLSFSVFF